MNSVCLLTARRDFLTRGIERVLPRPYTDSDTSASRVPVREVNFATSTASPPRQSTALLWPLAGRGMTGFASGFKA